MPHRTTNAFFDLSQLINQLAINVSLLCLTVAGGMLLAQLVSIVPVGTGTVAGDWWDQTPLELMSVAAAALLVVGAALLLGWLGRLCIRRSAEHVVLLILWVTLHLAGYMVFPALAYTEPDSSILSYAFAMSALIGFANLILLGLDQALVTERRRADPVLTLASTRRGSKAVRLARRTLPFVLPGAVLLASMIVWFLLDNIPDTRDQVRIVYVLLHVCLLLTIVCVVGVSPGRRLLFFLIFSVLISLAYPASGEVGFWFAIALLLIVLCATVLEGCWYQVLPA